MSLSFYGTRTDQLEIWRWFFETPGIEVFEVYSRPDLPNRHFRSWGQIADVWDSLDSPLAAWSLELGPAPVAELASLSAGVAAGLGGRERRVLNSPAFIHITGLSMEDDCLRESWISRWRENGARQRSIYSSEILDAVEWTRIEALSRSISRRINKVSPAKLKSIRIMPDAWTKLQQSEIKLGFGGQRHIASCDEIQRR